MAAGGLSIVTSGLVLALDAADKLSYPGSGTSWFDLSGNNTTGTLTNGPTFSAGNMGSIVFDGTNDYVIASNSLLSHGTSDWTYSTWLKFNGTPSLGTIFENGYWNNSLLVRFETSVITIYSMSTYWGNFTLSPTLGLWYKLDFFRNGNTLYFYLNGKLSQSISFTADIQPTSNILIGSSQHAANQCFNGNISQFLIYNRALSATEVLQNYNATKARFGR